MLELTNGNIVEQGFPGMQNTSSQTHLNNPGNSLGFAQGCDNHLFGGYHTVYWNSYPVYVCSDKTAKAIEILKKLQAEKVVDVKSVPRFIELVEEIGKIL